LKKLLIKVPKNVDAYIEKSLTPLLLYFCVSAYPLPQGKLKSHRITIL